MAQHWGRRFVPNSQLRKRMSKKHKRVMRRMKERTNFVEEPEEEI